MDIDDYGQPQKFIITEKWAVTFTAHSFHVLAATWLFVPAPGRSSGLTGTGAAAVHGAIAGTEAVPLHLLHALVHPVCLLLSEHTIGNSLSERRSARLQHQLTELITCQALRYGYIVHRLTGVKAGL